MACMVTGLFCSMHQLEISPECHDGLHGHRRNHSTNLIAKEMMLHKRSHMSVIFLLLRVQMHADWLKQPAVPEGRPADAATPAGPAVWPRSAVPTEQHSSCRASARAACTVPQGYTATYSKACQWRCGVRVIALISRESGLQRPQSVVQDSSTEQESHVESLTNRLPFLKRRGKCPGQTMIPSVSSSFTARSAGPARCNSMTHF